MQWEIVSFEAPVRGCSTWLSANCHHFTFLTNVAIWKTNKNFGERAASVVFPMRKEETSKEIGGTGFQLQYISCVPQYIQGSFLQTLNVP